MQHKGVLQATPLGTTLKVITLVGVVAACTSGEVTEKPDSLHPPGVDLRKEAEDGIIVGNRLMAAGEYELALNAFTRAALQEGMSQDVLIGIGTANLELGRLGQSEKLLRQAVDQFPDSPEAWNNLGVVLMEAGKTPEAQQVFQKAYALDDGESDSIRDNLRLALAKSEKTDNTAGQSEEYKLVQRGQGEYLIRRTP